LSTAAGVPRYGNRSPLQRRTSEVQVSLMFAECRVGGEGKLLEIPQLRDSTGATAKAEAGDAERSKYAQTARDRRHHRVQGTKSRTVNEKFCDSASIPRRS